MSTQIIARINEAKLRRLNWSSGLSAIITEAEMKRRHPMSSRDHATELVESYILDMGLRPGDRLPSERDMCRMWDLNRTTLRNAIQRLVSDGVLYCRMGSGTYVAQPKLVRNLQDVKGFSELYERRVVRRERDWCTAGNVRQTKQQQSGCMCRLARPLLNFVVFVLSTVCL